MLPLRLVPYDRLYAIPGRAGVYQSVNCDEKRDRGVILVRVSPVVGSTLMVRDSFWLDWDTQVNVLPRPEYRDEEISESRK